MAAQMGNQAAEVFSSSFFCYCSYSILWYTAFCSQPLFFLARQFLWSLTHSACSTFVSLLWYDELKTLTLLFLSPFDILALYPALFFLCLSEPCKTRHIESLHMAEKNSCTRAILKPSTWEKVSLFLIFKEQTTIFLCLAKHLQGSTFEHACVSQPLP